MTSLKRAPQAGRQVGRQASFLYPVYCEASLVGYLRENLYNKYIKTKKNFKILTLFEVLGQRQRHRELSTCHCRFEKQKVMVWSPSDIVL